MFTALKLGQASLSNQGEKARIADLWCAIAETVAQATINQMGFEQLAHPAYSPDLAPSDFHLFRALKTDLRGRRFGDDKELKSAVDEWFNLKPQDFFHAGIAALEHRWSKCIEVRGDYIEK